MECNKKRIKKLLVSGIIATSMLFPVAAYAQGYSDNWFKETDHGKGDRVSISVAIGGDGTGSGGGFQNQGYGEPAPLGSGLLTLLSLGMGYTAVRRLNKKH